MNKLIVTFMFLVIFCVLFQPVLAALPTVTSGTLHTHLSADYGTYSDDMGSIPAANGEGVAFWSDQSGNSHYAIQYYQELEPNLVTNAVNGKPVLRFDGANDYTDIIFSSVVLGPNQPYTVFLVLNTRDVANEYIYDGLNTTNRQAMSVGLTANPSTWWFWAGTNLQTTDVRQTLFQNHTLIIDSNNLGHYIYGELQGSGFIGAKYLNSGMRLGSANNGTSNGDFDIAELIIYTGALSSADRQSLESYLETKYAIDTDPQPDTSAGVLFAKYDGTNVTVDGSSYVTSWNDQVGSMNLLSTDVNKPSLTSVVFPAGTKNVIHFAGDANGLRSNTLASAIPGPTTCFVVARRNSNDRATYVLDGLDATNRRAFMADGSPRTLGIYSQYRLGSYTPDIGMWQVFTVIYNGLWSQIYVDGFNSGPEYGYIGNLPFEGLTVGSHGLNGANRLDGDIAEILIYEGNMDDANRITVEQSLFTKYGIGPQCGAAYTTYNNKDFNKDCTVNFGDFGDFAEEWFDEIAPGAIPWKESEDFDYKYEMDYYPWDVANVDLNGDSVKDWIQSSSSHFSLADGILSDISATSGWFGSNDTTYPYIWPMSTITAATGFTFEYRVKLHPYTTGLGGFKVQVSPVDSIRTDVYYFGDNFVRVYVDGTDANDIRINTGDNTDDFHVFRSVRHEGDPTKTTLYRDGVELGVFNVTWTASPHRFYAGDIDGTVSATYDLDYVRFTGGAWAPIPYNAMDFDKNCKVGFSDLTIFVLEWLKCTTPGELLCD